MHCQWARVSLVLVALAGAAFSAPLDPGGVSIDFEKVSARRFSAESADLGPELLRNGGFEVPLDSKVWWSNCWLQIPRNNRTPTIDANEARIVALGRKERVELAEGGSAFLLEIPAATDKLLPGLTQSIAATGSQFLRFTEPQGALRFSLRVRCDRLGKTTASPSLILNFKGEGRTFSAKGVKSYYSKVHRLPVTKDWTTFERIIPLHDDVRQVRVTLRLNGIARVWFDDVSVRRVTLEHPLETVLCAMAWMDNTFALSQKDPAFMWFVARKLRDVDLSESKLVLCVKLPAAVDVLEARESTRLMPPMPASDGFRTHRVDITRLRQHIRMDSFRSYTGYGLLVTTQAQPGVSLPDGEYWLERDGARATDVESFSLAVLPQLRPVSRPRKFHTGAILGPALRYGDRSAPMQARFLAATGMNWLHGITGSVLVKALREKGITLSAQPYYLCNGYRLGDKPKPEGARFVQTDGTAFPRAICPSEIYSDGPYYRDVVIPYLEKAIQDGMDHLMCNWEPYMFRGKGCFCPRCRREFASFTKQASEKVLAMKPEDILQGDRARWTAFRSSQHARQVTTLEKKIGEIGKACGRTESHLILEV
ncbi:MAG: hypothetical protein KAI66_07845, partial [Lentisphaeria bacterium]|nr:hypothetical protein [Lentisphaeria bacterium]